MSSRLLGDPIDLLLYLLYSGHGVFFRLPISSSSSLGGHINLLFDLLYSRHGKLVSAISRKVSAGFSPN